MNDGKPTWVVGKVMEAIGKEKAPVVALLGLAYKPDVDDLRESPSVHVAEELKRATNAKIIVCEPFVDTFPGFELVSLEKALDQSNVVVMLTDHSDFKRIPAERLKGKHVIDTRGVWKA